MQRAAQLLFGLPFQRLDERAVHVGFDDRRVHVALAADGLRVAQSLGNPLDRLGDVPFGRGRRVEVLKFLQRLRGERRAGPRAKILGREVLAADLPQVVVHVARADIADLTRLVQVLEELLSRQIAACVDDRRQPPVLEVDLVLDAVLAAEVEADRRAANLDVLVVHRRQPERMVVAGVLLVADANQRRLQQLDRGREHLLARQAALAQMTGDGATNLGQRFRERDDAFVFVLVLSLAPPRVVAILLAAAGVAAGGLQVSVRRRADPDVFPRRRNRQCANPGDSR